MLEHSEELRIDFKGLHKKYVENDQQITISIKKSL